MNELNHCSLIVGDPSDPILMVKAHVMSASLVVLPSADPMVNQHILTAVRGLKEDVPVIVRAVHPEDAEHYQNDKHVTVICDVSIASTTLSNMINEAYGLPPAAVKSDVEDDELTPEEQRAIEDAKHEPDLAEAIRAKLHHVKLPDVHMPSVKMPDINLPKVKMPKWHMPKISLPEVSIRFKKKDDEPKADTKDVPKDVTTPKVEPQVEKPIERPKVDEVTPSDVKPAIEPQAAVEPQTETKPEVQAQMKDGREGQ